METKIEEKVLWYKGYNYFFRGEYDKAIKIYNEVINKEHNEYGYLLMGILKKRLKKYDEAIENFDMYIKLSKNKSKGYGYRGLTKLKLALFKQAIDDIMKSIELEIESRKKDIKQDELNKFYEILKTYKNSNVYNPENRAYSIPLDISGYFKSCICYIGYDNNSALNCLQHLSNIYYEISK